MEASSQEVSPLNIFSNLQETRKSFFSKSPKSEKRIRPIMDLKSLMTYVEVNSHTAGNKPLTGKSLHMKARMNQSSASDAIKPLPLAKSRFIISRPSTSPRKLVENQLSSLSSKAADKPTLREKRLYNAQVYRQTFSNSGSLEKIPSSQKANHSHFHIKPIFTRESSPVSKNRKMNNFSVNTQAPAWQQESSTAFSIDLHHMDSAVSTNFGDEKSPLSKSYSGNKPFRPKDRAESKDQWKDYSDKVSEHLVQRYEQGRKRLNQKYSTSEHDRDNPEKFHERVKPTYSKFIKKNFDDGLVERLDTFGNFAFTTLEREENREIPVFFNETKCAKDTLGTMGIVDLWSQRQRTDLVKRANFTEEKKMIEKFSFYRVKDRKLPANTKRPQFVTLHRKNENVYKDLLARQSYTDFVKKSKDLAYVSPLERHMFLTGKQFYKSSKEGLGESNVSLKKHEIVGNLDHLIQDIDKFAEENQGDYLKLIEFSTASKKEEKKDEAKDKKLLKKMKKYVES